MRPPDLTPNDLRVNNRLFKCDEKRPICSNCTKRNITCEYFDARCSVINHRNEPRKILPRQGDRAAISSASPTQTDSTDASSSRIVSSRNLLTAGVQTPAERLLELRLFYHYLEMTTRSTDIQMSWAFWIMEEAVQSPPVMDALLGFSAFHLRRHAKTDRDLREASHRLMGRAIKHHREQLRKGFDEKNAASIAATCAIVSFHANVNRSLLDSESGRRLPVHWFRSFQMGLQVVRLAQSFNRDLKLNGRFERLDQLQREMVQRVPNDGFDFLLRHPDPRGPVDEASLDAYSQVVALISSLYYDLERAKPLIFFIAVPPRYVELLAAKDPRALAILGYFFMLLRKSRQFWWMDGAPEEEFAAIMTFLPAHWRPVMSWAMLEFEKNV
ncbi:hypothetical protein ACJ41O_014241 [Fusarium nematophilum]